LGEGGRGEGEGEGGGGRGEGAGEDQANAPGARWYEVVLDYTEIVPHLTLALCACGVVCAVPVRPWSEAEGTKYVYAVSYKDLYEQLSELYMFTQYKPEDIRIYYFPNAPRLDSRVQVNEDAKFEQYLRASQASFPSLMLRICFLGSPTPSLKAQGDARPESMFGAGFGAGGNVGWRSDGGKSIRANTVSARLVLVEHLLVRRLICVSLEQDQIRRMIVHAKWRGDPEEKANDAEPTQLVCAISREPEPLDMTGKTHKIQGLHMLPFCLHYKQVCCRRVCVCLCMCVRRVVCYHNLGFAGYRHSGQGSQ
jgi:hypothetical protein